MQAFTNRAKKMLHIVAPVVDHVQAFTNWRKKMRAAQRSPPLQD
jgi:hypothetical protein